MDNCMVSIIVPVYKVERYLPRCIESILKQTYTNFELILIDDGTPDRSGIICDRYAEKDSRIRVIHKENGGVSSARNAGLDVAQGEWITFIDSDDWVSKEYLFTLLEPLEINTYDFVVASIDWREFNVISKVTACQVISKNSNNSLETLSAFNTTEFLGPWCKLYNKKIIDEKSLRFDIGIAMGEDSIFVARYLKYCQNIHCTGNITYHYNCLNQFSVTNRSPYFKERKEWELKYLESYRDALKEFCNDEKMFKQLLLRQSMDSYLRVARSIVTNMKSMDVKKELDELFNFYDGYLEKNKPWTPIYEGEKSSELAMRILNRDIEYVYRSLLPKKKCKGYVFLKHVAKKIVSRYIERYRDGLIKYKF